MASPLSVDLRERVVAAAAAGTSCHRAATRFRVSRPNRFGKRRAALSAQSGFPCRKARMARLGAIGR